MNEIYIRNKLSAFPKVSSRYLNAEIFRENVVIARCIFPRPLITRYQTIGEDLEDRQERPGAIFHERNLILERKTHCQSRLAMLAPRISQTPAISNIEQSFLEHLD